MKIEDSDGQMTLDGDCAKTLLQTVSVKVESSFVGTTRGVVTIHAGDINGFYFKPKQTYVVFARPLKDGSFAVTNCGGTKLLQEAEEDIAYLQSWSTRPISGKLYGSVGLVHEDPRRMVPLGHPLKDQEIKVSGPEKRIAITDALGSYKVENLKSGVYTLQIDSPSFVWPDRLQKVELIERGCAKVDFNVVPERQADGSIRPKESVGVKH